MDKKDSFAVRIAGVPMRIETARPDIRPYFAAYLTGEDPLFTVSPDPERRERLLQNLLEDGQVPSERQMELLGIHEAVTEALIFQDVLLLHGSALAVDGRGMILSAPSGTGKSTHARLIREVLGERALMVNDDKPYLRFMEDAVLVCGSPWMGKHRLGAPVERPLQALVFLERGKDNKIRRLSAREALPRLLPQIYRPREADKMQRTLALIDRLVGEVSFYALSCNMEKEAAQVSLEGVFGPGTFAGPLHKARTRGLF